MGSLVQLTRRTEHAPRLQHGTRSAPRQLNLVFDMRLRNMTAGERQTALRALAQLLFEAVGATTREVGDDNA